MYFGHIANANKVYTSAVAKSQKVWGPYLEAIMKVNKTFIFLPCLLMS